MSCWAREKQREHRILQSLDTTAIDLDINICFNSLQIDLFNKGDSFLCKITSTPHKIKYPFQIFFVSVSAEIIADCPSNNSIASPINSCKSLIGRIFLRVKNLKAVCCALSHAIGSHFMILWKFADKTVLIFHSNS